MKVRSRLSLFFFIFYLIFLWAKQSYDALSALEYARSRIPLRNVNNAFFCPEDNVRKLLIGLINAEQVIIYAALYQITDEDIANALVEARKRKVKIEIITDKSSLDVKKSKVALLRRHKIPVHVYKKGFFGIMHNKFYIFGRNINGRPLLWTGSANATANGTTRNEENVIVTENRTLVSQYVKKFSTLRAKVKER